ncbi:hypothetical protein M1349_03005 [Patescibacteria group bacterium]|nr:hypothetical protein [Patescibacteria group bacterium]
MSCPAERNQRDNFFPKPGRESTGNVSETKKARKIIKPTYTPLPENPPISQELLDQCPFPLGSKEAKEYFEYLRGDVSRIDPLDFESDEAQQYLNLLRINSSSFGGVYEMGRDGKVVTLGLDEFCANLQNENNHPFVGRNIFGEILGFATIQDKENARNVDKITNLVVINEMQDKKNRSKTGRSFLVHILEHAFSNPDYMGRTRTELGAEVVKHVYGWEKADYLFEHELMFTHVGYDSMNVYVHAGDSLPDKQAQPEGRFVQRPTELFVIDHDEWGFVHNYLVNHKIKPLRVKYLLGETKTKAPAQEYVSYPRKPIQTPLPENPPISQELLDQCPFPLDSKEAKEYFEYLRGDVSRIDPLDFESDEAQQYLNLLRINSSHFSKIYILGHKGEIEALHLDKFRSNLRKKNNHPLVARNIFGEILGFATIIDGEEEEGRHNHDIGKLVKKEIGNSPAKTGASLLRFVINYAFDNPDSNGKARTELTVEIVKHVDGWEKVDYLFGTELKFKPVNTRPGNIDVYIHPGDSLPDDDDQANQTQGRFVNRSTEAFAIGKSRWYLFDSKLANRFDQHRSRWGLPKMKDEARIKKLKMKYPHDYIGDFRLW